MKIDIILSGVGGQGILSIATVIGQAALVDELNIKQAEVHGMSQRGGDVQSNLRISSEKINSDLIPRGECDLILSLEPMESLRYLPYLSKNGWVVTSSEPFINIVNYPELDKIKAELELLPNLVFLDIETIAKDCGVTKGANMVLLGAASPILGISYEKLEEGIRRTFSRKGEEIVSMNLKALKAGRDAAEVEIKRRSDEK